MSPLPPPHSLEHAYRGARYGAALGDHWHWFRIDHYDAAGEQALSRHFGGLESGWAILTPCNPHSQRRSETENQRRLQALERDLDRLGWRWRRSLNRDPQGTWPDEPGCCIADPDPAMLILLGQRYAQNALLVATLGSAPQLRWLPRRHPQGPEVSRPLRRNSDGACSLQRLAEIQSGG